MVLLLIASMTFISSANYPESNLPPLDDPSVTSVFGEKETKPINVCNKENATLLERLTCADEVKSSYFRGILKELIIRQEELIKELKETKEELKELREQKKIKDDSQILTGDVIKEDTFQDNLIQEEEKQDGGGILGFFKKLFNLNKN